MSFHSAFFRPILQTKMSGGTINISKFATTPFSYAVGDTFKLPVSFSYDVTNVLFDIKIYDDTGATALTYTDVDFILSGTRKKTITKTPAQFNLVAGTYRLVLTHTFPDGTVKKRFDSILTVHP